MPELPEVETIRAGLARLLPQRKIEAVAVYDSPKSFPNGEEQTKQFFFFFYVLRVRRRV